MGLWSRAHGGDGDGDRVYSKRHQAHAPARLWSGVSLPPACPWEKGAGLCVMAPARRLRQPSITPGLVAAVLGTWDLLRGRSRLQSALGHLGWCRASSSG